MLPYSAEALYALWGQYNTALWPMHLLFLILVAVVLGRLRSGGEQAARAIGWVLVLAWLWTAIAYHWLHLAQIHFAAPAYALLFGGQALLLAGSLALFGHHRFRLRGDLAGFIALGILAWSIIGYPVADHLAAEAWPQLRFVGTAPGPTALFTLGLLLLLEPRVPYRLAAIPLLWMSLDGVSAWVLGMPVEAVPVLAAVLGLVAIIRKNRISSM